MAELDFTQRQNCPACQALAKASEVVYSRPYHAEDLWKAVTKYYPKAADSWGLFDGVHYELRACRCGLIFQVSVPNDALAEELYDRWLNNNYRPEKDPGHAAQIARPTGSRDGQELLAVASYLGKPVEQLVVYDYGMGWGLWSQVALQMGCEVYGYDLSEERCDAARRKGVTVAEPHEMQGKGVDFVNTEQVMEHVVHVRRLSEELSDVANEGILKISVPNGGILSKVFRGRGTPWHTPLGWEHPAVSAHPLEHINSFTAAAVDSLAEQLGRRAVLPGAKAYGSALSRMRDFPGPKGLVRVLGRPAYHRFSSRNLYRWLVR